MTKRLLTNSFIFLGGTLVLSVFNYLYNTSMGRILGPENYGVLGSLLAFISIITLPTNAIATVAMRFSAHYQAKNDPAAIHAFFNRLTRQLGMLGLIVVLTIALLSPLLASFLHLDSKLPVIFIAPLLFFVILLPLNRGILQGLQRFGASIINQSIDPILKLTVGLLLVKGFSLGVNGAVITLTIASAVAYLASYLPLKSILSHKATPLAAIPKEVKAYSAIALVAFLLATLLMNIDILMVKHFLTSYQAGLYTALSTLGKIVLFVTTPIVSVMFPMISDLSGRNKKHYHILFQSFLLVTAISLTGVVGYFLLPNFVVKLLFGVKYLSVAPLLGLFGIVMLLYSLINLWVNYFLSIGNGFFIWILGLSVGTELVLLSVFHANFTAIINDLLIAMIVGFVGLTGYYLYLKRDQINQALATRTLPSLKPTT